MSIGLMRATLRLHGCRSLKEKRSRLNGLRDRFGKSTGLTVCESHHADELQHAEWTFVAVAGQAKIIDQSLGQDEQHLSTNIDAEFINLEREWLS